MEACPRLLDVARRQAGCVTRQQALHAGMGASHVEWLVQSGEWVALSTGVYLIDAAIALTEPLPFATRLHASLLVAGRGAVACLGTAALLHHLPTPATSNHPIELVLPPGREKAQRPGVRLHFRRVARSSLTERVAPEAPGSGKVLCTTVLQTVADTACAWSDWDAISLVDSALASGQLDDDWESELATMLRRTRGAVAARRRIDCADGRAQSPLETRVRLIAAAGGMPPDHLQHPIRDRHGVLLGYADLAWDTPTGRVLVAECDGRAWHQSPAAVLYDRRRSNGFVGTGAVDVVRFTWEDTHRPSYIRSVLRAHLAPSSPSPVRRS